MGPLVVIGVGIIIILWILGWLTPRRMKWLAATLAVLFGFRVLALGNTFVAAGLFVAAAWLVLSASSKKPPVSISLAEARDILGVSENADEAEIKAAYRRLIADAHPDAGGTEAESSRINCARDMLMKELRAQRKSK